MHQLTRKKRDPHLHAVAIAGGSGTRLWPLSRRSRPKPLLRLAGKTLLAQTFDRVRPLCGPSRWWMVVGQEHAAPCRRATPKVPPKHVLVEPAARNTLPAVALAAAHVSRADAQGLVLVLPADHYVRDPAALVAALRIAASAAAGGAIATLGITPNRPETGYGYIELGPRDPRGGRRASSFREKPNLATARRWLKSKRFLWNAGIFVLHPETLWRELRRQLPATARAAQRIVDAVGTPGYRATLRRAFAAMQAVSIDYGIMEGAQDVVVVPVDCGWSDVGDIAALAAAAAPETDGNLVVNGRVTAVDATRNIVASEDGHLVALLGVEGLAVVHTPNATLVMPRGRAQEVRRVVARLVEQRWDDWR